jgi:tetratricopeptide repeat protein
VLGFVELSLGDPAAALEHLRRAWEIRETFLLEPGMRMEVADTLEALIAVGELDETEALIVPWEHRSRELDRAWALANLAHCRGLLLAARGDLDGAFASFERALAEHARSVDPFHHARTLLALAGRSGGQSGAAPPGRRSMTLWHGSRRSAHRSGPRRPAPSWRGSAAARPPATS